MRLIDADELGRVLAVKWNDNDDGDFANKIIWQELREAPTIKGKWKRCKKQNKADLDNGNALYECSNCGHTDLHAETQEVPYCWYCGAKMRGEEE